MSMLRDLWSLAAKGMAVADAIKDPETPRVIASELAEALREQYRADQREETARECIETEGATRDD